VTFTAREGGPSIHFVVWQFWGRAAGGVLNLKFRTLFYCRSTCSDTGFCATRSILEPKTRNRKPYLCDFCADFASNQVLRYMQPALAD